MIKALKSNFINFTGRKSPELDRNKTVAILGTSSSSEHVVEERGLAYTTAYNLAKKGFNIITGGGYGIMSSANAGAKAADPSKSFHADVATWIDKHPEKLSTRVSLKSNANRRTELFSKIARYWVVFPGGPGTGQEVMTGISSKYYKEKDKPDVIICVGRKFFNPLLQWLGNMEIKQLAKNSTQTIAVVDKESEIMDIIDKDQQQLSLVA